jgi:hypothetical protein
MLATFGLERLESMLHTNDADDEVAELIERSVPAARVEPVPVSRVSAVSFDDEPGLPTRLCRPATANPQFQPTRHANRV